MDLAAKVVARFASQNIDVGFKWNSPNGAREIVRKQPHPQTGEIVYGVSTKSFSFLELIKAGDIESDIKRDEQNYELKLRTQQKQEEEAAAKAEKESWLGFTDRINSPTLRRKVVDTLSKQAGINGRFKPRGQHIIDLVKSGWILGKMTGKRSLLGPEGSFFFEKDLTKIGLDFAEYLIEKRLV